MIKVAECLLVGKRNPTGRIYEKEVIEEALKEVKYPLTCSTTEHGVVPTENSLPYEITKLYLNRKKDKLMAVVKPLSNLNNKKWGLANLGLIDDLGRVSEVEILYAYNVD